MTKKKVKRKSDRSLFLDLKTKYELYEKSVQNPDGDLEIINREFRKIYKRTPLILREDFAGTALLSNHWVKQGPKHIAYAIDLDETPINYGKENHHTNLVPQERSRLHIIHGNVLDQHMIRPDVIVAFNFSYFIFKKREDLLAYFKIVRSSMSDEGAFFIDLFGGLEAQQQLEEKTKFKTHTYHWDCAQYNPITADCLYYIHFTIGKKKFEKVFTYDWRMWGMAELCDILKDAGFSQVNTFWEEDDEEGGGNGVFYRTAKAENCLSWVTYIVALP